MQQSVKDTAASSYTEEQNKESLAETTQCMTRNRNVNKLHVWIRDILSLSHCTLLDMNTALERIVFGFRWPWLKPSVS